MEIRHATALPVREISALGIRPDDSGDIELLAVGDEDFAVIAARCGDDGVPSKTWRHDLFLPLVGTGIDMRGGSGFEGVAADGGRNVFLLQEEESRLLVLSPDLSRLMHVLALDVPADAPGYGDAWHEEPNKRGEGLVLLREGHAVLAKQKSPVRIIEFGPAGDEPLGLEPDTVLPADQPFEVPDEEAGRLAALAAWRIEDDGGEPLPTINDLAVGGDGRVYMLSAEAHVIARLEKRLRPGEKASVDKTWTIDGDLPGGDDARPEGLAVIGGSTPVVGLDSKVAGDNLVVLAPPNDE